MIRSVFSNWFAMVLVGAMSFVLTPILIRHLGDHDYGLWILAAAMLEYYSLLDLGLKTTVQRYVAACNLRRDREALEEVFVTSLALALAVAVAIVGLTVAATRVFPWFIGLTGSAMDLFARVVLLLGCSLALAYPARILGAYLAGLQRFDLHNAVVVSTAVLRAGLLVAVLSAGQGLVACAVVAFLSSALSLVLHWKAIRVADPNISLAWQRVSLGRMRELAGYSFYVFLTTIGAFLRSYTDSIVIARFLALAMIAPFSVAARLMEYFSAILFAITQPLMSRMSQLATDLRGREMHVLFLRATRVTALLSLFIGSLFWLHGRSLLQLWVGPRFVSSYPLLLILAAGYVVALAQSPSISLLMAGAKHRALGWWTLGEGVANVLLSIYWVQRYGVIGVALGTVVPMIVSKMCVQPWYTLRACGLSGSAYLRGAFLRPVAAAIPFNLLCLLASDFEPHGTPTRLIAEIGWQSVAFACLAYLVGLTPEDRQWIRAQLDRWWAAASRHTGAL